MRVWICFVKSIRRIRPIKATYHTTTSKHAVDHLISHCRYILLSWSKYRWSLGMIDAQKGSQSSIGVKGWKHEQEIEFTQDQHVALTEFYEMPNPKSYYHYWNWRWKWLLLHWKSKRSCCRQKIIYRSIKDVTSKIIVFCPYCTSQDFSFVSSKRELFTAG